MFNIKKLQTTENKSVNQVSIQTVLLLQTVFAQKSRSAVILADITIAHRAHLTDFPVMRPGTQYTATLCRLLLNSFHVSRRIDVAQKFKRHPCVFLYRSSVEKSLLNMIIKTADQVTSGIVGATSAFFALLRDG